MTDCPANRQYRNRSWPTRYLAVLVLCLAGGVMMIGCAATGGEAQRAQGAEKTGRPSMGEEKDRAAKIRADEDQGAKEAEAQAENRRKLAKLERDLEIARQKLIKARVAAEHAEMQNRVAVAEAQRELELEQQRLATFKDRSAPNRIEWSRLGLIRAEDRVKEAQEELAQLELMYAEEDFADQTKEIVLERGRRRLERSQRDLVLRNEDHAILTEETIPTEQREHEFKVEKKSEVLDKAGRDAETSALDHQIGIISAEAEVARLEAEIGALREKIARRDENGEAQEEEQE